MRAGVGGADEAVHVGQQEAHLGRLHLVGWFRCVLATKAFEFLISSSVSSLSVCVGVGVSLSVSLSLSFVCFGWRDHETWSLYVHRLWMSGLSSSDLWCVA